MMRQEQPPGRTRGNVANFASLAPDGKTYHLDTPKPTERSAGGKTAMYGYRHTPEGDTGTPQQRRKQNRHRTRKGNDGGFFLWLSDHFGSVANMEGVQPQPSAVEAGHPPTPDGCSAIGFPQ